MSVEALRAQSRSYYEAKLREHGPTPRGVDWNSRESQETRFRQLARLVEDDAHAGVLDYGCGVGALYGYLRAHGHLGRYTGFDVSPAMIEAARQLHGAPSDCHLTASRTELEPADVTLASGLLNVKQAASAEAWRDYVFAVIAELAALSRRGFAFNALTAYSDPERRRDDLYYADPLELFEHCRATYSRHVALLHDYRLYEFTLLVRL